MRHRIAKIPENWIFTFGHLATPDSHRKPGPEGIFSEIHIFQLNNSADTPCTRSASARIRHFFSPTPNPYTRTDPRALIPSSQTTYAPPPPTTDLLVKTDLNIVNSSAEPQKCQPTTTATFATTSKFSSGRSTSLARKDIRAPAWGGAGDRGAIVRRRVDAILPLGPPLDDDAVYVFGPSPPALLLRRCSSDPNLLAAPSP